ncbi:MAG: radical SAM protein [Spirochaetaceae bacterium]|jgi:radical SAM superfamily enzyme YgiQ (UPF0313 family)|nr:radical SAM protein [Spirochaetaceae bacterium]
MIPQNADPVILIQPPFVQLNGPYPAPYYLKSFLEARGYKTAVWDHSIGLFERIFCRSGLERIFADARISYERREPGRPGYGPDLRNRGILYYVERFLSEETRWLSCIGRLTAFLRGRDREFGHLLALENGTLPAGPRFDARLKSPEAGAISPGTAPLLAGKLLADLADFITVTLDPSFSLVRYAPALTGSSGNDFPVIQEGLNGYILNTFYRPFLEETWTTLENSGTAPLILGVTIPFPGCLAGALTCAGSAKTHFRDRAVTIAGGGYVNTELRFLESRGFFDYFDYLSFDRGYGSLERILDHVYRADGRGREAETGDPRLYKTMYRSGGRIIKPGELSGTLSATDRESVKTVFPDYGGVDFSRYLYPADGTHPMHRLWSDGHWLKVYLAHGCCWHACAFCDTELDYIRGYEPVDPEALFRHLTDQAEKTGVRAIHLTDEAAPVSSLIRFAELNHEADATRGEPFVFWGNIRFQRDFTPDTAALLAAGGLVGVSAGIEVATEGGLKRLGKGIGLADVIRACAAFKEAGILTHGYLIYGYWDEDDQEIVNSAEILRRLFAEGLLDSAFWHKFVLTRHSRLYGEWRRGLHRDLVVRDPGDPSPDQGGDRGGKIFARNDLRFEGEEGFDRFTGPLDKLLAAWMAGDTSLPVEEAFPFRVPKPTVPPDLVLRHLDQYARDRDAARKSLPRGEDPARVLFLGSRPVLTGTAKGASLFWRWRMEDHRPRVPAGTGASREAGARKIAALLEEASHPARFGAAGFFRELEGILGAGDAARVWRDLRKGGLLCYPEPRNHSGSAVSIN